MIAHSMKSKERPWTLTKKGSIHEVKKDHKGPKSQKEGKREIIIIKKEEEDLDSVEPEDMQQDEHQGPRTLMCHFECLRRGPWLTYGKAKAYVQISSKKSH